MTRLPQLIATALLTSLAAGGAQALEYRDGALPDGVIAALERAAIQDWYRTSAADARAVPARFDTYRVYRYAQLPAGVDLLPLPDGLAEMLRPREGHEIGLVDGDVVLVETETGLVRDIMREVAR